MAQTDPVEIVVDIIDQFSDDLAELRAQLEQIDAMDLNIDFDIMGDQEIEQIIARIQAVPNNESVFFHARMMGLARVRSQIASVQAQASMPALPGLGGGGVAGGAVPDMPALPAPGGDGGGGRAFRMTGRNLRKLNRTFGGTMSIISRVTPNMMMLWNILAAMIPVIVALGGAVIGLAGAFGALAAAGAAIIGVGLLGWGEDFSSSMENLSSQAEDLGARLFEVMQPAAQTFQPILSDWMEGAPRQVEQLVGPMQELTVFADALEAAGTGFVDWVENVINSMVSMEDQVEQLSLRFGDIVGSFIIDFMEAMVQFTYENQNALIQLASAVGKLFGALLNISMAIAATLATMSPLVELIAFFAELLNTDIGRAILTAIASLLLMNSVLGIIFSAVAALNGILTLMAYGALSQAATYILSSYIPAVQGAIASTMQWVASLGALRAALLTTGIGAALVVGGFALNEMMGSNAGNNVPSSNTSGSGGGNTYVQIDGDVGRREYDRLIDKTHGTTREEMSIQEDMNE